VGVRGPHGACADGGLRPAPRRAAARILTKDIGLATALAASVAHATPLGDAALARFRETLARGWAELDDAAVIKTYQD
jgi:putative dehydrogenase